ncbi:MAG TPA: XRE family transcriptional regulator [Prolixibacteraceae bacterium]|nr:XRE family transcriptional regulator [Prolixibacteraceae bacterium]
MSEIKNVGLTITLIRHQKNITTNELAERCGFTTTMMEQIEQNKTIPSLGHLIKVARALGVRLGTFLDDMDQLGPVVTRSGDIKKGTSFSNKNSNSRLNLDFFPLASDKSGRHMEPFIVDINPSTSSDFGQSSHEGEEFIYVLNGKIEIKYGKDIYALSEGDSIYYDSVVDHHVHAADESPAKILAVVYAPF